ncbi:MAG: nucleotidyltransferase family protein [Acidimicrobiales bacterium]|nr:nucleotidyltransferase family protein [Acidimicrobiales bacterium]
MTTAAVVLAAGAGSRFSGPRHKLLTVLGGQPVVAWSVGSALAAGLDETIVVQGAVSLAAELPPTVTVLDNPDWAGGLATSLRVAVDHAVARAHEAIVVGLGDQPGVTVDAWRTVAAAVDAPIAVACYGGRRGHPVRLASAVFGLLPSSGDSGARELMRLRPDLVREIPFDGEPGDIDRMEDLGQWS